jgi:pyruvate dehydrogenase (quinone)
MDVRPEQIGRRAPVDFGVAGDVRTTVKSVLPLIKKTRERTHLDRATEHYHKARKDLDGLSVNKPGRKPIHPQQVAKAISDQASADAIFTCDVGLPTVWAARYLAMNGKRRLIGSFWHGSMANAMLHAIGAQTAFPGQQVISLSGDGGFTTLMDDFLSLAHLGLPVKIVVFNNTALGFVEIEQKSTGFLDFDTDFKNPNFVAMAEATGVSGIRLEDPLTSRRA